MGLGDNVPLVILQNIMSFVCFMYPKFILIFSCVPIFAVTMGIMLHAEKPGCSDCPKMCQGTGINCMNRLFDQLSSFTSITEPGGKEKTCLPACNSQVLPYFLLKPKIEKPQLNISKLLTISNFPMASDNVLFPALLDLYHWSIFSDKE